MNFAAIGAPNRPRAPWTTELISHIERLMGEVHDKVRNSPGQVIPHDALEAIFTYPYARMSTIVDLGVVAGREKLYVNRRLLAVLGGATTWTPL